MALLGLEAHAVVVMCVNINDNDTFPVRPCSTADVNVVSVEARELSVEA